jgi:flagellar hook-associated protein 3 FlgL
MRVTQQLISTQVKDGLQQAYRRMAQAQEQVTTGRRINHISDDPIGATRVLALRTFESSLDQFTRNINNTMPSLEMTDNSLGNVVASLTRAKELALAMVNDTNTAVERQAVAKEIHQILLQTVSDGNTNVDNRFIFGGFKNGTAPFTQAAGVVTYLGDNNDILIQTDASSTLPINLAGNKVFQGAGVVGGVGVFDVLHDLETVLQGGAGANALSMAVNLDSSIVAGAGFTPVNAVGTEATPATWLGQANFTAPVTVFDSKGQAHNLTFLFAKTNATTFKYRVVANSNEITGGTPGNLYQVSMEGTWVFNVGGTLNAGASTLTDITLNGLADGANNVTISAANLSFAGSTQLAQPSAVLTSAQTDTNGFNPQLGRLDAAINQLLTFRAEVGARLNGAEVSNNALDVLKRQSLAQRSKIEDADVLAVYSDFARFQQAFQAALKSASEVVQMSLLDFLR